MEPRKFILDTDIGDDIDDALALTLGITEPGLRLLGVNHSLSRTRKSRAGSPKSSCTSGALRTFPSTPEFRAAAASISATSANTPRTWSSRNTSP